jgi:hypothetical protein
VADQIMAGIPASATELSPMAHDAVGGGHVDGEAGRMQANGAGGDLDHGTARAPGGGGFEQTEEAKVAAVPRKTLEAHWVRITEQLIEEFGQNVFDCWFRRVQLEGQRGNTIVLTVPTKFLRSWIRSHYLKRIKALWNDALNAIEDVALDLRGVERVPPNAAQPPAGQVAAKRSVSDARRVSAPAAGPAANPLPGFESAPLEKRMTFETFLQDASNQLARAAAPGSCRIGAGHAGAFQSALCSWRCGARKDASPACHCVEGA